VIRVLFVDDEPLVLRALGRMAHGMREECDAAFASSGEEALTLMADRPFDVLVSDMRMPGMDGAAVLTQAERRFPWIARIILSGYTQYESALRALPVCHRFLSKPLRAEDLRLVLLRTIALHRLLSDPALRELVGEAKELPARPQVYFQLRGALANPSSSMRAIARIVERDAGITGPASRITSAQQAISHLGTELMTGLVLSLECFGNFEDMLAQCELIPESLERKAYLTATITAELLGDETQRQDAFLAALLHDCGLLLLAARRPAMVSEAVRVARQDATPLHVAERKLWGTTHAQIGAYLLGLWGLPYPVVEAVASCHAPSKSEGPEFDVGGAVYMAAALAEAAMAGDTSAVELDADFVQRMQLAGRIPEFIGLVERIIGQSEDATSAGADIH
jgi:HD-like signal output (HDOD) protein/ActR/RegA family two-component response regulator